MSNKNVAKILKQGWRLERGRRRELHPELHRVVHQPGGEPAQQDPHHHHHHDGAVHNAQRKFGSSHRK